MRTMSKTIDTVANTTYSAIFADLKPAGPVYAGTVWCDSGSCSTQFTTTDPATGTPVNLGTINAITTARTRFLFTTGTGAQIGSDVGLIVTLNSSCLGLHIALEQDDRGT